MADMTQEQALGRIARAEQRYQWALKALQHYWQDDNVCVITLPPDLEHDYRRALREVKAARTTYATFAKRYGWEEVAS